MSHNGRFAWEAGMNKQPSRILVIDDQSSVREMVADLLREFELADVIEEADSIETAKRALRKSSWDVVITDMSLGDGNILDLFESLNAPEVDFPSVLLMSGFLFGRSKQRAQSLGIHHIMHKPFLPNDMIDTVMQILGTDNASENV